MILCNGVGGDDHEEVCYEGLRCPACDAIIDLRRIIEEKDLEMADMQDSLDDLQSEMRINDQ